MPGMYIAMGVQYKQLLLHLDAHAHLSKSLLSCKWSIIICTDDFPEPVENVTVLRVGLDSITVGWNVRNTSFFMFVYIIISEWNQFLFLILDNYTAC